MAESEVVSFHRDKKPGGITPELHRRKSGAAPSQPALWTAPATESFAETPWGAYPKRFRSWATKQLHCDPREVLHVCSGGLPPGIGRARVDLRRSAAPDVVADGRKLPFADNVFHGVLIDPPYSVEYAQDLYQTSYPRPSHLLAEAARVATPCSRIGIVHFFVPMPPPGCRLESVRGVTTGCGYRIRALTIFEKYQDSLFPKTETEE